MDTANVLRRVGIGLLMAILLLLIGFVPPYLQARRLRAENERLALEVNLGRIHGELGMMNYEAARHNFANAATHSTRFFDELKEALRSPAMQRMPDKKARLEQIVAKRDEITSDLARVDPAVQQKVAQLFVEYHQVMSGAPAPQ